MFSSGYFQRIVLSYWLLVPALCLCVVAFEDVNRVLPDLLHLKNETNPGDRYAEGHSPDASPNGREDREETVITPPFSPPPLSSVFVETSGDAPVNITPTAAETPSMIITATKVTIGHRMLPISSGKELNETSLQEFFSGESSSSNGGRSEMPSKGIFQKISGSEIEPSMTSRDYEEQPTGFYKDVGGKGGHSYRDNGLHDGGVPEKLPAPLALINLHGEGNNPPLEEDFAEAFRKGSSNSNGKRKRFRESRKNKLKLKTLSEARTQMEAESNNYALNANAAAAIQARLEQTRLPTPSPSPPTISPKFKRVRSTTPNPFPPLFSSPSTTESPAVEDKPSPLPPAEEQEVSSSPSPVVKNGPRPIITQNIHTSETPVTTEQPQGEKLNGNTEKISTYYFSTPVPSTRLRLRQKVRDSLPLSTTTTTERPTRADSENDLWRHEFKDFRKTSVSSGTTRKTNFKVPPFVPMSLGLETDDGQDAPESTLPRPNSELQNKAYSIIRHNSNVEPHREHKTETNDYDIAHTYPSTASENLLGTEYYAEMSNTEPSTTFTSNSHPPAGSHYDRTKDTVVFYNSNPYSATHKPSPLTIFGDISSTTPGIDSQTVGTHFSVYGGEGSIPDMSPTVDPYGHNGVSMYPQGQVYPSTTASSQEAVRYGNGYPSFSVSYSPNLTEHSTIATMEGQHHAEHHPHMTSPHHPYALSFIDNSHPTPGAAGGSMYGTVEEVPVHGGEIYGHQMHPLQHPHQHHPHQHQLQHQYPLQHPLQQHHFHDSNPYASEQFGTSSYPPVLAHPHIPETTIIMSGPPHENITRPHYLPTQSPHHFPGHPPSFTPSPYDLNPHENHEPFHIAHPHISESPSDSPPTRDLYPIQATSSEDSHNAVGHGSNPILISPQSTIDAVPEGVLSSPGNIAPSDPHLQSMYEDKTIIKSEFPTPEHTMSIHPDYEPANPPLPHDHPFHTSFIPFPTQDLQEEVALTATNPGSSEDALPTVGGPFHPGTVENVPSVNEVEFTPIPDDPKDNSLYSNFVEKPSHNEVSSVEVPQYTAQRPEENHIEHTETFRNPPTLHDQSIGYLGPGGQGEHEFHVEQGPSGSPHDQNINIVYSRPVTEHSTGVHNPHANGQGAFLGTYQHHEQHYPTHPSDRFKLGQEVQQEALKPNDLRLSNPNENLIHDAPIGQSLSPEDGGHGLVGVDDKKEDKRPKAPFSNTPYVLMFPQLVPEEAMRPSPPSLLSREIPVVQASSLPDFTSGEKSPIRPGFQNVPVHPRDQMYQVLAKAHYDKMMDKYMESKRRPPSAIYTPYGILVPVGANVDTTSSMSQHNSFSNARPPPKHRSEKSLLSTLFGSPSAPVGRFQHPNKGRMNKILDYEPAIDLLAEKLALKLVSAHHGMAGVHQGLGGLDHSLILTEKMDEKGIPDGGASKSELKGYLKKVLKDHFHELAEKVPVPVPMPVEELRRPPSLSSKLFNSIFRKGRLSPPFPPPMKPMFPIPGHSMIMPTSSTIGPNQPSGPFLNGDILSSGGAVIATGGNNMMSRISGSGIMPNFGSLMPSASVLVQSKVPPPPGISPQGIALPNLVPTHHPPSHYHSGIGHPFPPIFSKSSGGFLGSIRRLFGGPVGGIDRHEVGVPTAFDGRLFSPNASHVHYLEGGSPRLASFSPKLNQAPNQGPPMSGGISAQRKTISPSHPFVSNSNASQIIFTSNNRGAPPQSPLSRMHTPKSDGVEGAATSTQNSNPVPLPASPTQSSPVSHLNSTMPKPKLLPPPQRGKSTLPLQPPHKLSGMNSKSSNSTKSGDSKSSGSIGDGKHRKRTDPSVKKRKGSATHQHDSPSSTPVPHASSSPPPKPKPTKLDMFQTLLGSTRSVLNYFKSEARKNGPTVLKPRNTLPAQEETSS